MITQTQVILEKIPIIRKRNSLSVKIQGYLMQIIPDSIARDYHDMKSIRPYSLYLLSDNKDYDILYINTLTEEASILTECLSRCGSIYIEDINQEIKIKSMNIIKQVSYNELYHSKLKQEYIFSMVTPATYKINNSYSNWFQLSRLLNSVVMKWNLFSEYPIDKERYRMIDNRMKIVNYNLVSTQYQIMNKNIDAFKGNIKFKFPDIVEDFELAALLGYANFSGIGAKTAMGMGGILINS